VSLPFARRVDDIEPFRVVAVLERARQLEAQGRDIVHMEVGEPDFVTAEPIIAAARAALDRGLTHYTPAAGLPELRAALSRWYGEVYGVEVPARRILITPGASGALLLVSALLLEPGRELLLADPGYPCNRHFLRLVEGGAQLVPVGPEARYQLDAARAEAHWRAGTVGALVASPANPTGEILDRDQLAALDALCRARGGWLLVDEIYHGLTYGCEAPSVLAVSDRAFVINSFSKYFGMTGWRLGWLVAPEAAVPALEKLAQNLFISMSTPAQYAALAAFEPATRAELERRRAEFGRRRDYLADALRGLGFGIPHTPSGAFYLYADCSRFSDDCERFCLELLERHGVAITPGTDFGSHRARSHVRFAYTTSLERLREGVRRLRAVCG
jgi:aspartate/methionine/tyrosine aminotransferase